LALFCRVRSQSMNKSKTPANPDECLMEPEGVVRFKWRRQRDLFSTLLNGTHELSQGFRHEYSKRLIDRIDKKRNLPFFAQSRFDKIKEHPEAFDLNWAEQIVWRRFARELLQAVWLEMLLKRKLILIDTPDYSKTDRRLITRDLEDIYWLWNTLTSHSKAPNIVLAIQKEMYRDNFFFDKMQRIELEPLQPKQMLEAYVRRFKSVEPFTENAILTLAGMSRGIFRRFLRYITLTLNIWEDQHGADADHIEVADVKAAISTESLAEDMELELAELFPKRSNLRLQAVRLLMLLDESGSRKQGELAEELGMEPYEMTRLLARLELHKYVARTREGIDRLVSLRKNRGQNRVKP
jgi:hypothetical protein